MTVGGFPLGAFALRPRKPGQRLVRDAFADDLAEEPAALETLDNPDDDAAEIALIVPTDRGPDE